MTVRNLNSTQIDDDSELQLQYYPYHEEAS